MQNLEDLKSQAVNFLELENIKKILIVTDDDEDGFTSALQMKRFLEINKQKVDVFFNDKNDKKKIYFNRKLDQFKPDFFVFLDLSEDIVNQNLTSISNQTDNKIKVLIFDHHPSPTNFVFNSNVVSLIIKPQLFSINAPSQYPTCKVVYDFFGKDFDKSDFFTVVGLIGDTAGSEWLDFIKNVEEKYLAKSQFEKSYFVEVADTIKTICSVYTDQKIMLFNVLYESHLADIKESNFFKLKDEYIKLIESEKDRFFQEAEKFDDLELIFFEAKPHTASKLSNILSSELKDKTVVIYSFDGNLAKGSFRRSDFKVNVGKVINESLKNIDGAQGGGHVPAGGFGLPKEHFNNFKQNVIHYLKENYYKN
ncbi:MAG: DHHA1 domain-containing protein [Candidatus ainarchaeum sp.]|nr:DHHA1 domain-containing protein [Candidatus ainarchaeum sp.]